MTGGVTSAVNAGWSEYCTPSSVTQGGDHMVDVVLPAVLQRKLPEESMAGTQSLLL